MNRLGPSKVVSDDYWEGRLRNAESFHEAARALLTLREGQNANPVIVQIVDAAIAYGDAVTARRGNRVNQENHQALPALLRAVVGNRITTAQLGDLQAIVRAKDAASYGVRPGSYQEAERLLERLDAFAAWAQAELNR